MTFLRSVPVRSLYSYCYEVSSPELTKPDLLRNLRRSFKLVARGPVSSGPLGLPLMIQNLAPLTASTRACATWLFARFDWLSRNGAQSHRHKGTKQKAMSEPPDPAATAAVTAAAGTAAAQRELLRIVRALAITFD
jgi:hypothetical protein